MTLTKKLAAEFLGTMWLVLGGALGVFFIYVIASGQAGFAIDPTAAGAFATNGFGAFSPGGYSMMAAFIAEVVLTAIVAVLGCPHYWRCNWRWIVRLAIAQ